jgi:hypothetical protein
VVADVDLFRIEREPEASEDPLHDRAGIERCSARRRRNAEVVPIADHLETGGFDRSIEWIDVEVGEQGRQRTSLGGTQLRIEQRASGERARTKQSLHDLEDLPVRNAAPERLQQERRRNRSEEIFDVRPQHPRPTGAEPSIELVGGRLRRSARAISPRESMKFGVERRSEQARQRPLDDAVAHAPDRERPMAAAGLWNGHMSRGHRSIRPREELDLETRKLRMRVPGELGDRDTVRSWCTPPVDAGLQGRAERRQRRGLLQRRDHAITALPAVRNGGPSPHVRVDSAHAEQIE